MQKPLLAAALLAALAAAPAAAHAQALAPEAVSIALQRSNNVRHGGWGWGEAVRSTVVRVEFLLPRGWTAWGDAGRANLDNATCPPPGDDGCPPDGERRKLHAGVGYRLVPEGSFTVPYLGVGYGVLRWEGGSEWVPQLHFGVDVNPVRRAGVRVEYQTSWATPESVAVGVRVTLP